MAKIRSIELVLGAHRLQDRDVARLLHDHHDQGRDDDEGRHHHDHREQHEHHHALGLERLEERWEELLPVAREERVVELRLRTTSATRCER